MALSAGTLKSLMKTKVDAINDDNGAISNDAILQALAEAVVEHIQAAAKANVTSGSSIGQWPII